MINKNKMHRNVSNGKRRQVFNRQSGRCSMCGQKMQYTNFTVDHIVPISNGGSNSLDNLEAMCYMCNHMKDNYSKEDFLNHIKIIYEYKIKEGDILK